MAHYTTEVRSICEHAAGLNHSESYSSVNAILKRALPKIFDFDFPIFDPSYRNVLETKILRHYYTREIAFETVGLWKLKLDTRLNEIMPYYNQLYKSTLYEYNPYYDVDLTKEYSKKFDGKENTNTENNTNGKDINDINQSTETIENNNQWENSTQTENGTSTGNEKTVNEIGKNDKGIEWNTNHVTGGDTETTTATATEGLMGKTTETLTRNTTDKTTGQETTSTDTTTTTNSSLKSDVTGSSNATSTLSGEDSTTSILSGTKQDRLVGDVTETRDLTNNRNNTTTVTAKQLDTPQDNLNLFTTSQYLTAAGHTETDEVGRSDETGTINTETTNTTNIIEDSTNTATTEYGRVDTQKGNSNSAKTDVGNGSEVIDGSVIKDVDMSTLKSGTDTTVTDRTDNKTTQSNGNKRTEHDTTETSHKETDNVNTENQTGTKDKTEITENNILNNSNRFGENTAKTDITGGNTVTRESNNVTSGEAIIDNLEKYTEKVFGRNGGRSFAATLNEFRSTFLNIDMQIINELNDLFFTLW